MAYASSNLHMITIVLLDLDSNFLVLKSYAPKFLRREPRDRSISTESDNIKNLGIEAFGIFTLINIVTGYISFINFGKDPKKLTSL